MPDKTSIISEIGEDIRTVLTPKNVSTMALPWLSFARTMVQIAKEDTKNYTYVNPINKLILNTYLGASMVLRETNMGQRIYENLDVSPGEGKKIFEAATESWVKAVSGATSLLEAKEVMLTAVIDEMQAVRKRADEAGGDGATGEAGGRAPGGASGDAPGGASGGTATGASGEAGGAGAPPPPGPRPVRRKK